MRRMALIAVGAFATASLLFFFAPAFRQAFRASLAQWHVLLHVTTSERRPELDSLARRAEEKHDAEGLAFVAVRHWDSAESVRLAEEAVHLDRKLIWVLAIVAVRHPDRAEILSWVPQLEAWDPQNALPHLITAESIDIDHVLHERVPVRMEERSPAWQDAMAAASQSPRLDDYLDRLRLLDRRVIVKYGVDDPYLAMSAECNLGLPSYSVADAHRYSKFLLESGERLEAQGDAKTGSEKYLTVARFGQMLGPSAGYLSGIGEVVRKAYGRLDALSERDGNHQQAQLYAYLGQTIAQAEKDQRAPIRGIHDDENFSHWTASVVRASGLMMLFFDGLVLLCGLIFVLRTRSFSLSSLGNSGILLPLGLFAAIGLLLSSATLYVCYRPYAQIFQSFIRTGSENQLPELSQFLEQARVPLGVRSFYPPHDFVFYFWCGVTALCFAVLFVFAIRILLSYRRAHAAS